MRRLFVLAALAAALVGGPAAAQLTTQPTWAVLAPANRTLLSAIEEAGRAGRDPPTLATSGAQIRTAFSVEAVAGSPNDVRQVAAVCETASDTLNGYIRFGGSTPDVAHTNYTRFQDEIMLGLRFQLRCWGRVLPLMPIRQGLAPNSPERNGLTMMQSGMVGVYSGAIRMQLDDFSAANRQMILDEAITNIDDFTAAMTLDNRRAVVATIDQVLASRSPQIDAPTRQKLQQMRTAIGRATCTGLCAL